MALQIWEDLNRFPGRIGLAQRACLFPVTSPSGGRIACGRADDLGDVGPPHWRGLLTLLSTDGHSESELTTPLAGLREFPQGWSRDGGSVLAVTERFTDFAQAVWFPVAAAPRAERAAVEAVSDPDYDLDHVRISPDGRLLAFGVLTRDEDRRSLIFVRALDGGPWIPIGGDSLWMGKPEWAPLGDVLYFLARSSDHGEIRGIRLDRESGEPVAPSFRVACLDSPDIRLADHPELLLMSAGPDSLTVTVTVKTGDIWCLDD